MCYCDYNCESGDLCGIEENDYYETCMKKWKDYKSKFPRVTSREQFELIDYNRDWIKIEDYSLSSFLLNKILGPFLGSMGTNGLSGSKPKSKSPLLLENL